MTLLLLLLHGLCAFFLLGAISHQAVAMWWPGPRERSGWWSSLRSVHVDRYVAAVILLYLVTIAFGAASYPAFRLVRAEYLDAHAPWATGLFEIKEHAGAFGLALLPSYAMLWREPGIPGRRAVTTLLALVCWWNFLVGHVTNDLRGL